MLSASVHRCLEWYWHPQDSIQGVVYAFPVPEYGRYNFTCGVSYLGLLWYSLARFTLCHILLLARGCVIMDVGLISRDYPPGLAQHLLIYWLRETMGLSSFDSFCLSVNKMLHQSALKFPETKISVNNFVYYWVPTTISSLQMKTLFWNCYAAFFQWITELLHVIKWHAVWWSSTVLQIVNICSSFGELFYPLPCHYKWHARFTVYLFQLFVNLHICSYGSQQKPNNTSQGSILIMGAPS